MERGRPTKYDPKYCELARRGMLLGYTIEELATLLDVDDSTIYRWMNKHDDFCDAIKGGGPEADAEVTESLYLRARGYSHPEEKIFFSKDGEVIRVQTTKHYPPDATSAIYWLKNRQPHLWRDKHEVENIDPDKKKTIEELEAEIAELTKKLDL